MVVLNHRSVVSDGAGTISPSHPSRHHTRTPRNTPRVFPHCWHEGIPIDTSERENSADWRGKEGWQAPSAGGSRAPEPWGGARIRKEGGPAAGFPAPATPRVEAEPSYWVRGLEAPTRRMSTSPGSTGHSSGRRTQKAPRYITRREEGERSS